MQNNNINLSSARNCSLFSKKLQKPTPRLMKAARLMTDPCKHAALFSDAPTTPLFHFRAETDELGGQKTRLARATFREKIPVKPRALSSPGVVISYPPQEQGIAHLCVCSMCSFISRAGREV